MNTDGHGGEDKDARGRMPNSEQPTLNAEELAEFNQ